MKSTAEYSTESIHKNLDNKRLSTGSRLEIELLKTNCDILRILARKNGSTFLFQSGTFNTLFQLVEGGILYSEKPYE